jgi:hypothetical protein
MKTARLVFGLVLVACMAAFVIPSAIAQPAPVTQAIALTGTQGESLTLSVAPSGTYTVPFVVGVPTAGQMGATLTATYSANLAGPASEGFLALSVYFSTTTAMTGPSATIIPTSAFYANAQGAGIGPCNITDAAGTANACPLTLNQAITATGLVVSGTKTYQFAANVPATDPAGSYSGTINFELFVSAT